MRHFLLLLVIVAWTVASYSALLGLGSHGIDPVHLVQDSVAGPSVHGTPILSATGSAAWLGVIAVYGILAVFVAVRTLRIQSRRLATGAFLTLFAATAGVVAIFHPMFLLTVLPAAQESKLLEFVREHLSVLEDIYLHWGLMRHAFLILAVQVLVTLSILGTLFLRSSPTPSSGK